MALMNGHKDSVKITILENAPTAQSPSLTKRTYPIHKYNRQLNTIETIKKPIVPGETIKRGTNGEEEVQSEDTQSEDDDGGHLLDFVCDAVENGQVAL